MVCGLYKKQNCPFCNKRFMRMKSLLDHMVLRHSQNKKVSARYLSIRNELILGDIKTRFVN
jgi:hypothetical protein